MTFNGLKTGWSWSSNFSLSGTRLRPGHAGVYFHDTETFAPERAS